MAAAVVNTSRTQPARLQRGRMLEHLQGAGLVDASAIARAELVAVRTGQPVEQVLNQLGSLSDEDLAQAYAEVARCEIWDPAARPIAVDPAQLGVSIDFLRRPSAPRRARSSAPLATRWTTRPCLAWYSPRVAR